MPGARLSPRLTHVAEAVVTGTSVEEAMRAAGYTDAAAKRGQVRHKGSLIPIEHHPIVAEALRGVQAVARKRAGITRAELASRLDSIYQEARATGELGHARRAVMDIARLLGLIVEKRANVVKRLEDMTDDELRYVMGEGEE